MLRKTILGSLTVALSLISTVALAETGTNLSGRIGGPERIVNREANINNSSTTRSLLRDRVNASSTKMVDSQCAKTAVDVRKTSLVSIYGTYAGAVTTALTAREDAVKASFDGTSKKARQDARIAARSAYRKSVKTAFEILKTTEKSTMKKYATSIKACDGTSAEASDESSDGSVADSIK